MGTKLDNLLKKEAETNAYFKNRTQKNNVSQKPSALSLVTPKERVEAPSPRQVSDSLFPNSPFLREQPNRNSIEVLGNMHRGKATTSEKGENRLEALFNSFGKATSGGAENKDGIKTINPQSYAAAKGLQGLIGAAEGTIDNIAVNSPFASAINRELENARKNGKIPENAKVLNPYDYVLKTNLAGAFGQGVDETSHAFFDQIPNEKLSGNLNKAADITGNVGASATQMFANMAMGGGLSKAAGIASKIPSYLAIGESAAGMGAQEARAEGASFDEAVAYGNLSGALEAGVEAISGGIPGLGKGIADKLIGRLIKIPNGLKVIGDIIGEGLEEDISTGLNPLLKRLVYNPDTPAAAIDEYLEAFVSGAALSGIMQGGNALSNIKSKSQDMTQSTNTNTKMVQDIAQQGIQAPTSAQSVMGGEVTPSMQGGAQTANVAVNNESAAIAQNINTNSPQNATLPDGMGAASQGFDPYTQAIEKYGVIPDGENPVRPADVPARLTDDTKVSRGARTAMEAEATTDEAYNAIGDAVMSGKFSYLPITDNAAKGRAEQSIKNKGWDNAVKDWTANARSGKVSKDLIVEGQMLYNNAVNSGNVKEGVDILVDLVKMSRTGAQATQANRVLKQLSPEYQLYALQRSVQSLSDELSTKLSKKGIDGITINKDLAQEYLDAKTDAERNSAMESLKDDIAAQVPSTWMDKWNAWRYLSMLGNPRTHIRNIVGNAGFVPVRMVKNVVATGLERTFGISSKTKSVLTFKDKPLIEHAFGDYNEVSEQIMSLGKMDNFTGDIDSRRRIFKSSALEGTRNFNTKALDVEDVWFAKPAYASALAGWYKANGITADALAGGKVSQNTIDEARAYAIREAQRATYRDSNEFSDWVSKLGRGYTGDNKAAKAANVLVEGVLPFKRTPANILTRAVEYSPVGLLNGVSPFKANIFGIEFSGDLYKLKNGEIEPWQVIDNISAGLTGTGLLGLGAYLASMGLLSGGASDDENERELDNLTGLQNYALNIGGKSITLDWLAPEALPLFVGVELYNAATDKSKDGLSLMTFLDKLSGITEPMFEMSMLQGVNDLFDSIKYSDKNNIVGVAATSAANYLSQGLPTLFGQLERSFEPERKTTYTDPKSSVPTSLQYMLGKASGKVPFWEYQQSTYRDGFGNTQSNGSLAKRLANNMFNPAYVRDLKDNEVTDELRRLNDENYLEKAPSAPLKSFDYGGEKHNLSADEYSKFQETSGKKSFDLMSALLKDSEYKRANDEKRAALMKQLLGYSNDTAKREYIGSGYKSSSYEKTHEAEQAGISPIDYFAFKSNLKDIDDNDSPSQLEKAQAIMPLDLATQYKGKLWEIQNGEPSDKNPFTGALAQKGLAPEKCMDIMDAYSQIDKDMENYVKQEGGAGAAQVQAAYFIQWLSRNGYNAAQIGAITEVFKTWQMIPIDKPSKKATAFVAQNPMP